MKSCFVREAADPAVSPRLRGRGRTPSLWKLDLCNIQDVLQRVRTEAVQAGAYRRPPVPERVDAAAPAPETHGDGPALVPAGHPGPVPFGQQPSMTQHQYDLAMMQYVHQETFRQQMLFQQQQLQLQQQQQLLLWQRQRQQQQVDDTEMRRSGHGHGREEGAKRHRPGPAVCCGPRMCSWAVLRLTQARASAAE